MIAEAGSGVPVLLLHAFPLDAAMWAPQLAEPAEGFHYLAPDLPGYGRDPSIVAPSIDAWADWVVGLLDERGIDKAVVCGLSMGGYLAFAIWRRHPDRVRALVLCDTRAGADDEAARAKRRENQALARAEGQIAVMQRLVPAMLGKGTQERDPAIAQTLGLFVLRTSVDAIVDTLQLLMDRPDSTPTLATITVPTLIICGDEDGITPVAQSRAMHEAIAGSQLAIIAQAGHVSNLEQPAVFNRLLSDFLRATIRTGPT